jgi:SAM-dependent methyltransferase
MCPRCGSGERHRLLYFYLRDRLNFFKMRGIKLLDVAPDGFLWDKVFSKAEIEYISIDVTSARQPTMIMSVTDLKFPASTFDAIICYHVLEHIPDDIQAMQELYRVLKLGGWAILQVPIWAEATVEIPAVPREEYAAVYGHKDHVRRYGLDYKGRLASVGFKVTLDDYVRQLPRDFVRRYGLFETEDVYFCEKA